MKYDRNRTRSFFCFVRVFVFLASYLLTVSLSSVFSSVYSVRNRKGRQRKVSYLVHIRYNVQ